MRVDLIWLGSTNPPPNWALGDIRYATYNISGISQVITKLLNTREPGPDACLFWDSGLPLPERVDARILELLACRDDVWHCGLKLGMRGLPVSMDYVEPVWMLNCDPGLRIEATSWRLCFRACLARTEVFRQMGNIRESFTTIEAAGLEFGHRCVTRGVFIRHVLDLLPPSPGMRQVQQLPFDDELRFARYRYGAFWGNWALGRALLSGRVSPLDAWADLRRVKGTEIPEQPDPFEHNSRPEIATVGDNSASPLQVARVTVLIPTLERYPYLRTLLDQLRRQTVQPWEIIVVDQTSPERSDSRLETDHHDLPLRVITLSQVGQCSARNAGLQVATGDYILFLDDDDEVAPNLIERHLESVWRYDTPVSSGVAEEVGAGELPMNFRHTRLSDVFPTNNSLVSREALRASGLFDLAYDHGQRADGDLGMRVYLSGARMVLNHTIAVLHHHAPSGGLRKHKARVVTYASSKQELTHRHLPSQTEIYLAMRYFTKRQLREMLWLRLFGTVSANGSVLKRAVKAVLALLLMPNSIAKIVRSYRQARKMMELYPQIPALPDALEVVRFRDRELVPLESTD